MLTGDTTRADAIMQRGELPASSRDDVHRLAVQLASRRTRPATPAVQATTAAARPANNAVGTDVPASMLQRFTTDGTAYEARP